MRAFFDAIVCAQPGKRNVHRLQRNFDDTSNETPSQPVDDAMIIDRSSHESLVIQSCQMSASHIYPSIPIVQLDYSTLQYVFERATFDSRPDQSGRDAVITRYAFFRQSGQ